MKIRENKKRIEEKKLRSDIIGYEKAFKHRKSKYKKIIKLRIPKNKRKRLIKSSILFLKKKIIILFIISLHYFHFIYYFRKTILNSNTVLFI